MTKSYNDIKEQEQRVMALCLERGRWCDNAKKRFDKQHLAQITQNALMQHGFPIFGQFDKYEKRAFVYCEPEHNPGPVNEQDQKTEHVKDVRPTPTEQAHERIAFNDWMSSDEENRKKIQDACRHAFVKKMYAELLTDMEICKLEGWDILEFPRMLKQALQVCFPKPVQLKLF